MKNWDRDKLMNNIYRALFVLIVVAAFSVLFYWALPAAGEVIKFVVIASLPFILAWLVAIIGDGAVDFFNEKLHMPRGLAVIIIMLLVFGFIGTVIALIVARLWVEVSAMAANMSEYRQSIMDGVSWIQEKLASINLSTDTLDKIREWLQNLLSDAGSWLSSLASGTVNIISSTPVAFVFVIVFFVALFFFCRDHDKIVDKVGSILPASRSEKVMAVYKRFAEVIRGFCIAQLILIGISMLICIVFFFILGVKGALTIGLLCGLLDILPVVGPALIILPWGIVSIINKKLFLGIGLLVLLVVLVVVKNIVQPKVVGDRIGLHPVLTLVGIFVGMRLFGVWGLAIGPILLAMIVCVYRSIKEVGGK